MSDAFFGLFLLKHGVITTDQLQEAVLAQKQDRLLLGQIALNRGLLSESQLLDILAAQSRSGKKFGQIAREKGFLTESQFQEILEVQSSNHVLLGEALVRKGSVGAADLIHFVREFEKGIREKDAHFEQELARHPHGAILQLCLEITRNYLCRLGYATKSVGLTFELPVDSGRFSFYLEQLSGRSAQYLGIHLSNTGMNAILGEHYRDMPLVQQLEEISQVLFNLNYIICEELRRKGHPFKHGAIQTHAPATARHLNVRLVSFIDNLDLSYSYS